MTLENKLIANYFKRSDTDLTTESPELFAQIHIDNPLGTKIKGYPNCKVCKGTGYVKCRSGKHERACKECLKKIRTHSLVRFRTNSESELISKVLNPKVGCVICKGKGIVVNKEITTICPCNEADL